MVFYFNLKGHRVARDDTDFIRVYLYPVRIHTKVRVRLVYYIGEYGRLSIHPILPPERHLPIMINTATMPGK